MNQHHACTTDKHLCSVTPISYVLGHNLCVCVCTYFGLAPACPDRRAGLRASVCEVICSRAVDDTRAVHLLDPAGSGTSVCIVCYVAPLARASKCVHAFCQQGVAGGDTSFGRVIHNSVVCQSTSYCRLTAEGPSAFLSL